MSTTQLCAWGVLEQRVGNLSAARRLYRSSLNINSQSYITWMTWAAMEEDQGNSVRAEEIRNLYFQQRTEVVDDASWVMGLLDAIDPTLDKVMRLLKNFDQNSYSKGQGQAADEQGGGTLGFLSTKFDLDGFVKRKLFLDASKLEVEASRTSVWRSGKA